MPRDKAILRILPAVVCLCGAIGPAFGGGQAPAPAAPAWQVVLPAGRLPFPTPLPAGRTEPGFKLRGTKGWAWTWDQYLAEIPTLVLGKMNFLMSCYTSVFTNMEKFDNRWWKPFSEATKQGIANVARACRENGITFCFSFHPALFSKRPLKIGSDQDFEDMWAHYAWVQSLGVRWFSLSYDDIDMTGLQPGEIGTAHAGLANRLLRRLREKDPKAELIFCPVYYSGCGDGPEAKPYLEGMGRTLDKSAYLFWTGDGVVTPRITRACAEIFLGITGRHRTILWDNYPVNDRNNTLHLGPVTGRDPDLGEIFEGYMGNPLCPQNEINRVPLLTCADYAYNPRAYDPARSIGQAILYQSETPAQAQALKELVDLYPGNLICGSTATDYNSVLEKFIALLRDPGGKDLGRAFIGRVSAALEHLGAAYPGRYAETKKTMASHIREMNRLYQERFAGAAPSGPSRTAGLTKSSLRDKIRGGWAGQTIGCTYGGPTEFSFKGTFIQDYQPIPWSEDEIAAAYRDSPGLYDDVYMDLTFVDVFEKAGLEAPAAAFAKAFAAAPYPLWHANQMARYNIQRGLLPPESGHWLNNPHADDIDFQIESDFAGLMSPGLPDAAAEICDRVGHIMNYGDGWYGGVYIAAMTSLAFVSSDIPWIAEEALKAIPAESAFAGTMRDVLAGWRADPSDWQKTWFSVLRRRGADVGCPDGVFSSFDIDAKVNCAWVLLGLLYGGGDFGKTLSVAARSGDDSDCNPASAGGILGVILGYDRIPAVWRAGIARTEDLPFPYVQISLRQAYDLSYRHALANIEKHGGRIEGESLSIPVASPRAQKLEVSFAGHYPVERRPIGRNLMNDFAFEFDGIGFALTGDVRAETPGYRFRAEVWIDGALLETTELPSGDHDRKETLFWKYGLAPGRHAVVLKLDNPAEKSAVRLGDLVVYADKPAAGMR